MLNSSSIDALIDLALEEDIGHGDITTEFLDISGHTGQGIIRARQKLVLAGLDIARRVFCRLDHDVSFESACRDGDTVLKDTVVAKLSGDMAALLTAERTALNFLQRLSGVATHVRHFTKTLTESKARLVDTRKTTPGWRVLEKYAVRVGGAHNHRMGLYDGVLIKDNHIAAAKGIDSAVRSIRAHVHHLVRIEVETESLSQVKEALAAGADVIMLDNMSIDEIKEAIFLINGRAVVEVSGGVSAGDLDRIAATGVDIISVGALTHGATFVDVSMDIFLTQAAPPSRTPRA
ncbi:MAG: carboxylating nicotinate-nucleotide diphosphorylase [Deltaproteobacteria bacterium]|nr:carboxylating nicotinate-nucleotide diphosphorylase [Deltaproteobacteria bacterium]